MEPNCLFCSIVRREVPADVLAEGDGALAFRDINPQAPTHVLVIPTEHVPSLAAVTRDHTELLAGVVELANQVARDEGVADGYRVVTNIGPAAGQSVDHLHLHVLGGRNLTWPPG